MSQVLERTVSEGFPVDGQIFQPPQLSLDNEKERYVGFLGSLIDAATAKDRAWTKGGGIEITNPCLRYVKNFIRKGRITPVLKDTHDYRPRDLVRKQNENDTSFFPQQIPPGYVAPLLPEGGGPSPVGNMMGKLTLPGQQIHSILSGSENMFFTQPRGVVEFTTLMGQPYRPQSFPDGTVVDPAIREIQLTIFPTYPFLPVLLDDIQRLIDAATIHSGLREIVDTFQVSLQQFRDYAFVTVENSEASMREIASTTQGYIPRYTPMDLVLLEQLGRTRRDREIQRNAQPAVDAEFKDMFKQFLESQKEEKQAMAAYLKSQTPGESDTPDSSESLVSEQTMMQPPEFGDTGQPGTSGASGTSGQIAATATDYDLTSERPTEVHWKTWEKWRKDAGLE